MSYSPMCLLGRPEEPLLYCVVVAPGTGMGNGPKTENPLAALRRLAGRLKRMPCFRLSSKERCGSTRGPHTSIPAYGDVIGGSNGASEIAPLEVRRRPTYGAGGVVETGFPLANRRIKRRHG